MLPNTKLDSKLKNTLLVEVSWEVCNKVGGIYTVLESKSYEMMEKFGNNYLLIGPYFLNKAKHVFLEEEAPGYIQEVMDELENQNIACVYGSWLIKTRPKVILIDIEELVEKRDEIKFWLWEKFKVDSYGTGFEFSQPLVWAFAVGKFLESLEKKTNKRIIMQVHEWLSGACILYLKTTESNIRSVFTTHATVLGRTLAGADYNSYSQLTCIDSNAVSYKYGVFSKHQLERAAATYADIFTTVSLVTANEAECLLGRKPDVITTNGIEFDTIPGVNHILSGATQIKERVEDFLVSYFFPYYAFELDKTKLFAISGRYEFYNKGIDRFIASLGILNKELKEKGSSQTVVAFFFIPRDVKDILPSFLHTQSVYRIVKDRLSLYFSNANHKLIQKVFDGEEKELAKSISKENLSIIQKSILDFHLQGAAPLCAFELHDEDKDAILNSFRSNELLNRKEDRVKVVFYPAYVSVRDRLLGVDYYEVLSCLDLGVFPSRYEPWGYTPQECASYLVPSLTTDSSGFGKYVKSIASGNRGIYVLPTLNKSNGEVNEQLFKILKNVCEKDKKELLDEKYYARELAQTTDWSRFIGQYLKAYELALNK